MQLRDLGECRLPKLRTLKFLLEGGISVANAVGQSRSIFLENHPSIEELVYAPPASSRISLDALPNLRSLYTNSNFISSLDGEYPQPNSNGLLSPPSTPVTTVTPVTPVPEETAPAPLRARRAIEFLSVSCLVDLRLLEANFLQAESLRALQITSVQNVSTIYDLALLFPNIEWLSLSPYYSNRTRADLIAKV